MRFIGERAGAAEDDFKRRVRRVLRRMEGVVRAFLPQHGDADPRDYVLALYGTFNAGEEDAIQEVFAEVFSQHDRLTVVSLTAPEHGDLQGVCRPFFERAEA